MQSKIACCFWSLLLMAVLIVGADKPATRPASEVILVRIGDKAVITQADFEQIMRRISPERFDAYKDGAVRRLVGAKLFELYLADHPELVTEEMIDDAIAEAMEKGNLQTTQELEERLNRKGTSMEDFRKRKIFHVAKRELTRRGEEMAKDEAKLQEIFQADPPGFDGSRATARQIMIAVAPYETPAQRDAKRQLLNKLREELISGKLTWEQCVEQSRDNPLMFTENLPNFARHLERFEEISEVVFSLKAGRFSEVFETALGFNLVEVTERRPGCGELTSDGRRAMRRWLMNEGYFRAMTEARKKYPVVGVQPPGRPAKPATQPSSQPATKPASTRPRP